MDEEEQRWRTYPTARETVPFLCKEKPTNQKNETEDAETYSAIYGHLVYHHKVDISGQWRKGRLFNKWCWSTLASALNG